MTTPKKLFLTGQSLQMTNDPAFAPEQQRVVRQYNTRAEATPRGGDGGMAQGGPLGTIPAAVQYTTSAGEMAQGARTSCGSCKHFDVKAWREFLIKATGPASTPEWRATIRTMEARIAMAGYGYAADNDHAEDGVQKTLYNHGICRVLSDWVESQAGRDPNWWPVVPWREASCPTVCRAGAGKPQLQVVTAQQPYGLYKPRDLDAQKAGAARYDAMMHAAAGKK